MWDDGSARVATMIQETVHLADLARQAYEDVDGDRAEGISLLIHWIKDDPALVEAAIRESAGRMWAQAARTSRPAATKRVAQPQRKPGRSNKPSDISGLRHVAVDTAHKLFDMSLPYVDKRLGDAKMGDIDRSKRELKSHIDTETWQLLFLESVTERLMETKTVRECFKVTDLENLMVAAQKAVFNRATN